MSVLTGLPWEYLAEQDWETIGTYLDVLKKQQPKKGRRR